MWWTAYPGANIGIVTGRISGILVIDCDTPEGYEAIKKLIPEATILPIARTPRGGWHLYLIFPDDCKLTVGTAVIPGVDFRGEGGYIIAPPSVREDGKGYAWESGRSLDEVEPAGGEAYNNIFNSLYMHIGGCGGKPQETTNNHKDHKYFIQGSRDSDLFHAANCLIKGGCEIPLAEHVLDILAKNCIPPFSEKEVREKIESALKRNESRTRNIASEVREWVETTNGHFETTTNHKELHLTTKEEIKAANMALLRLCEGPEPLLEKFGSKRGCYRRIDKTIDFMDFEHADVKNTVDLYLPLGLHDKTKIFPKGVIVVAGVSGMGKTLFCLNAIADNMGKFPIFYFNSEMGPEALKMKLNYFPISMSGWAKAMKVIDNWDFNNISDKIQPDAFNVIDYLEPDSDRPYNIHGVISAIIRRLNQGTALIAVQKKPDVKMGTGGVYSIKASTLALALDWGKIEIVKNRFREADKNSHRNKIKFDVRDGYHFIRKGDWYE